MSCIDDDIDEWEKEHGERLWHSRALTCRGMKRSRIGYLIRKGRLRGVKIKGEWCVLESSVRDFAFEELRNFGLVWGEDTWGER